jgi:hypothetical protein
MPDPAFYVYPSPLADYEGLPPLPEYVMLSLDLLAPHIQDAFSY